MEYNLYNEWSLFEKRTLELLKELKVKNINKTRLLKILEIPSLSCTSTKRWELYEDLIIRIDWFCHEDAKKFASSIERAKYPKEINPIIKYKFKKIDKSFSELLIQEVSNISIPLCTKREIFGCDGTDYELELRGHLANIKIKWWEDAPKQWEAVGDFTKRLIAEFDSILDNERYIDSFNFCGKLWLQPKANIKITKDLMNFLKQFSEFQNLNAVKVLEIFKLEKVVIIEEEFDYISYKSIRSEFEEYGLLVQFLI